MNKKDREHIIRLEQWFSKEHDRIMKEHSHATGILAKCIEGYSGGHDHAWAQWQSLLTDLGFSFGEVLKMREG